MFHHTPTPCPLWDKTDEIYTATLSLLAIGCVVRHSSETFTLNPTAEQGWAWEIALSAAKKAKIPFSLAHVAADSDKKSILISKKFAPRVYSLIQQYEQDIAANLQTKLVGNVDYVSAAYTFGSQLRKQKNR